MEETWSFAKDNNYSDDEDDEDRPGRATTKHLSEDHLDQINVAGKSHVIIIAEVKKKMKDSLSMAQSAAMVGWGAVAVLENKAFEKITGTNEAEKELKAYEIFQNKQKSLGKITSSKVKNKIGCLGFIVDGYRSSTPWGREGYKQDFGEEPRFYGGFCGYGNTP